MGKKAIFAVILLVLVLAGVIMKIGANLDVIAADMVEEVGTDVLRTRVGVSSVSIDLKQGKATINGLTVANPPGYSSANLLEVDVIEVDLALNSLPSTAFRVQAVNILAPMVVYEGDATGNSNIQTVLDILGDETLGSGHNPASDSA